jgi:hypothetical protein
MTRFFRRVGRENIYRFSIGWSKRPNSTAAILKIDEFMP